MKKIDIDQVKIELNCSNGTIKSDQIKMAESYLKDISIYIEEIIQYREFDVIAKAYDKYNQRNVFVNIIFNQDIQIKQEIENEILFLKKVRSEYLLRIFDCYFHKDISCLMIVMEYCSNGCFLSYYNSQKDAFKKEQIISIITKLSKGLSDIFNNCIINFKLNAQNLFLQENLQLKVYHLDKSRFEFSKLSHITKGRTSIYKPNQLSNEETILRSNIYCVLSIIDFLSELNIKESLVLKLLNDIFFHSKSQEFEEEMRVIYERMKVSLQKNNAYELIYNELMHNKKFPTSIRSQNQSDQKKDVKNGFWIYYYKNGNIFEGEWQDDKKNGKGIEKILRGVNAGTYDGEFLDNKYHGSGTYYAIEGRRYEGEFRNGFSHGKGTLFLKNGNRYEGEFQYGNLNGKGSYLYLNGDRYEGEFKNNFFNGSGTIFYKNGNRQDGVFQNGIQNGKGSFLYQIGSRYEGDFKNNTFNGQGTMFYQNGDRYEGEFQNGILNGKGSYLYQNGNRYEGEFKNNTFNGQGTFFYKNGDRLDGMFQNGLCHGKGTYIYKDGHKSSGQWKNGKYIDCCQIF